MAKQQNKETMSQSSSPRSAWSHRPRRRVTTPCKNPEGYKHGTKQAFKDECDINRIMSKYEQTGVISHLNKNELIYSEMFTIPKDAQDAIERVDRAREVFQNQVPAKVRDMFNHDPGAFYKFASDPKNRVKLAQMGLARMPQKKAQPGKPGGAGAAGKNVSEGAADPSHAPAATDKK